MPKSIFEYDVIDYIGEGAASLIYAVSDPKSKQLYALKHVVRKTDKDVRFIEQLENEFEVGKQVVHENLRRIVDMKVNRSLLLKVNEAVLLMELFDGVPLEQSLPRQLPALIQVFIDTAKGIEALHKLGYVHCDLKPSNILINNAGQVKVIDLGQACPVGTAKKRIQGTPDYIAPEQVRLQPVTTRTDIYNFGATMYWAICGRKMPTLFTLKKGENSILSDDLISTPRQCNPLLPESLSNFVMECTRTNPSKRPADMAEVIRRLEIIQHSVTKQVNARNSNVA
jgi:serine/threonine-protein kinase